MLADDVKPSFSDIGITDDLAWGQPVSDISSKATKTLGFLRRNLSVAFRHTKERIQNIGLTSERTQRRIWWSSDICTCMWVENLISQVDLQAIFALAPHVILNRDG